MLKNRSGNILCATFLIISSITLGVANAQDKGLKKFHWGVTSLSASQWIPWIAKEAKLYEKHGLEAELVLLRGSGQSAQAIIGGSILGAPCTLTTVIGANLSGADLVTVAHTVSGVQSKLLVRPDENPRICAARESRYPASVPWVTFSSVTS